jgi:chromosome segregation ATPase
MLVVALALDVYLVLAARSWQQASGRWEELARSHGTQVAQAQADLDATRTELEATQDQLEAAQQRITELADEKAQLGDQNEVEQQLTDYQARVSAAAADVASSLAGCVSAQDQLIGYLDQKELYDPTSLASFADQVQEVCAQATAANADLQQEIGQ